MATSSSGRAWTAPELHRRDSSALVRGHDVLARMGGEEVLVPMPQADIGGAARPAERLGRALREKSLVASDGTVAIAASIGLAQAHDLDLDANSVLRRADAAMHRAKEAGRDRVEMAAARAASSRAPCTGRQAGMTGATRSALGGPGT